MGLGWRWVEEGDEAAEEGGWVMRSWEEEFG